MSDNAPTTLRAECAAANIASDLYGAAAARCIIAVHNFKTTGILPTNTRSKP